jgi:predicted nucleic acid-binding protein
MEWRLAEAKNRFSEVVNRALVEGPQRKTLERLYADRLLPVDLETSRIWGELTTAARKGGRTVAVGDGLIAATARRHGLHVMTRNTADFESTGVLLLNPFSRS